MSADTEPRYLLERPWTYEHRPSRYHDDIYWITWSDAGECVAEIVHGEEDARRIVASVNATKGIPTEALEAGVVGGLLDALEALTEALSHEVEAGGMRTHAAEAYGLDDEYAAALEAVAKARGDGR